MDVSSERFFVRHLYGINIGSPYVKFKKKSILLDRKR